MKAMRTVSLRWTVSLCLCAASGGLAGAAEPAEEVVGMDRFGGSEAAKQKLIRDGFVVTDETYRQICSFYVHRSPAFVTTDSVLYAYLLNLEKSLMELEQAQAKKLPGVIENMRKKLTDFRAKGEKSLDALVKAGRADPDWASAADAVEDYLAVTESLATGATGEQSRAKLPGKVAREIELILAANKRTESPLRDIPLDYLRFQPRGMYGENSALRNYYRAATWMHEVPFRTRDESESRQAALLALICQTWPDSVMSLNNPYYEFLGPSDDLGPGEYYRLVAQGGGSIDRALNWLVTGRVRWKIVLDEIRKLPGPRHTTILTVEAIEDPSLYGGMRLLPRPSLFDNDVFAPLTPFGLERPPVSGEELMAALGGKAATEIVMGREAKRIPEYEELFGEAVAAVKEADRRFNSRICWARRSLYRTLLEEPNEPSLPAYYRHPDWRYKDLNTCLAGWAHHRYIWDMHGKRRACYGGLIEVPPGIVEPNEPFFRALLDLTVMTQAYFAHHAVKDTRFADLAVLLVEVRQILERQLAGAELTEEQAKFLKDYGPRLANVCGFLGNSWLADERLPDTPFCVPITIDVFTGNERVVGQARPRAIYVIAERDGQRFLTVGGVLSYRDWVGPAQGDERMTLDRWRQRVAREETPAPGWHRRFYVPFTREELYTELRQGKLREQMFHRPDLKMGEILVEKLSRDEPFKGQYRYSYGREAAVELLGLTDHPGTVECLFPMLRELKSRRRGIPGNFRGWAEAAALEGKLSDGHADTLMQWVREGHKYPHLIVGLVASIPSEHAEDLVLHYLDANAANVPAHPSWSGDNPWGVALGELLQRPGLRASRKLMERLRSYEGTALEQLSNALSSKWYRGYWHSSIPEHSGRSWSTEEDKAFVDELHEALEEIENRQPKK